MYRTSKWMRRECVAGILVLSGNRASCMVAILSKVGLLTHYRALPRGKRNLSPPASPFSRIGPCQVVQSASTQTLARAIFRERKCMRRWVFGSMWHWLVVNELSAKPYEADSFPMLQAGWGLFVLLSIGGR